MDLQAAGVHFVGSIPLEDAEEVFSSVARALAGRVPRIPDGETGKRSNWVVWQDQVFADSESFEVVRSDLDEYAPIATYRLAATADLVSIGELGYAAEAVSSYSVFERLKNDGVIPEGIRFQVSLPTPVAVLAAFVLAEDRFTIEPAYEDALLSELVAIVEAIPQGELSIQWDVAAEFGILEGVDMPFFRDWWEEPMGPISDRILRLGRAVPDGVELGYHLCYGDSGHKHFVQPDDAGLLVAIAQVLVEGLGEKLSLVHVPVPRDRKDRAYFAPLGDLALPPHTALYLGLIHATDGVDGAIERIAAAREFVEGFGIATECGLGRRSGDSIQQILHLHADVFDAYLRS